MPPKRKQGQTSTVDAVEEIVELKIPLEQSSSKIMDMMNDLRSRGVNQEIDLPNLVLVGDTSSGKSSVLTRFTGLHFPSGDDVVTTHATEVSMRRHTHDEIRVTIIPDEARPDGEQIKLGRFKRTILLNEFQQTLEDASDLIRKTGNKQSIFRDVLRVDMRGPECAPITVVDLPGLIHSTDSTLTKKDRDISHALVDEYIQKPRTIVLAIVSGLNAAVNQVIIQKARGYDQEGKRTMGIITKVDAAKQIGKEKPCIELIGNKKNVLQLGWHALVNRVEGCDEAILEEITDTEKRFFSRAPFNTIAKEKLGIDALRSRVVNLMGHHLVAALPKLEDEINGGLQRAKTSLAQLGNSRDSTDAQKKFLLKLSDYFQAIARAAVDGLYSDPVVDKLAKAGTTQSTPTLRAEIEVLHRNFQASVTDFGANFCIENLCNGGQNLSQEAAKRKYGEYSGWGSKYKPRDHAAAIEWVVEALVNHRGNELPGSPNHHAIGRLFRHLSSKWEALATEHLERVQDVCQTFVLKLVRQLTGEHAQEVAAVIHQ